MNTTHAEPTAADIRLVIAASSAGTVFEWYDFFIYGTLGSILSKAFFPTGNATLELLLFWLVFAVGFGFRPLGAVLFGFLGDRLGRKYTFLATVALMGVATAGLAWSLRPPASAMPRRPSSSCCAWRRGWRWAANMAARRSMWPNTARRSGAVSSPASSRPAWSAASCSA
jgi:MFS family permease